ncbi:bleomycin resistance protein [Listeria floridensis FSL S10-1187]|uniref:Bleomycin resistance protein n=1 Tax=Listeria floridensis FSL S10-1187 TaxID=1265817 RepID=A0ABN0RHR6_9LIST|nr:VOC family protein [Listeria floridensis]EUJ33406.1 bleomycin resistance protein [Listeria floridensis FSL S10-1187]
METKNFTIASTLKLGKVVLKVMNLEAMTQFYQEIIGLDLLEQTEGVSVLGIKADGTVLLELRRSVAMTVQTGRKTGLYHTAFLVPERSDLGNALLHYIKKQAPIIGASDHGYSEALYLNDPEGNGIEVYRDKPSEVWDVRADGRIEGITIEMDADGVVAAADERENWSGFPSGTSIGHVHLKVADLNQTEQFYTKMLGLSLKTVFPNQAIFLAAGGYHHHIGANVWSGTGIPPMNENDIGLDYYSFILPEQTEFDRLKNHLETNEIDFLASEADTIELLDPNGIKIKITY